MPLWTNDKCEELYCNNAPVKHCHNVPPSYEGDIIRNCIPKSDNSGCEYKSCEELTSNCEKFYTGNDDDKICTLNSSGNKWEIKSCSSLTENCGQLIPYKSYQKCALISEGQCGIVTKDCEDFKSDECDEYSPENEEYTRCLLDQATNKCKKITCEDLSSSECDKFVIYKNDKVCAPYGNKCKIQSCKDFSSDICESVEFSFQGFKCINTDKGCEYSTCYDTDPSKCGNFIPINKAYKCYLNRGQCDFGRKKCEELSKNECDLFNIEDNLEETNGKKCVEDDGKCVLNSNKLEFSFFVLFILFLLF